MQAQFNSMHLQNKCAIQLSFKHLINIYKFTFLVLQFSPFPFLFSFSFFHFHYLFYFSFFPFPFPFSFLFFPRRLLSLTLSLSLRTLLTHTARPFVLSLSLAHTAPSSSPP